MKTPTRLSALFAATVLLPIAQGGESAGAQRIAPPARIPDIVVASPAGEPIDIAGVPKVVRRAVAADAARRFQVSESAVVLSRAERVTWSDGSLGCPLPGSSYTQARVPGFRITATTVAGGMRYHTDARGTVVTCG